ncbi:hypothetical protein BT96DRAFT_791059, partial [Gymnopus androsaceus JB14]
SKVNKGENDDPLRRRFANALQWYMSLNDMATAHINTTLQRVHVEIIPEAGEGLDSEDEQRPRAARQQGVSMEEVVDEDVEERESRKRCRSDSDSAEEWDPSEDQPTLSRPSEYLRSRCPLCFGGMKCIIVAADACFTQKHSAQKGGRDPPRTHPNSYFIPEEEVNAWKHYADCVRSRKQSEAPPRKRTKGDTTQVNDEEQDHCEEGLRVPKSVLDGYLASFTAADE